MKGYHSLHFKCDITEKGQGIIRPNDVYGEMVEIWKFRSALCGHSTSVDHALLTIKRGYNSE